MIKFDKLKKEKIYLNDFDQLVYLYMTIDIFYIWALEKIDYN